MKSKNVSTATAENLADLRILLTACESARSDEEILPFVIPLGEAARSLRQSAVEGSLACGLLQSALAVLMGVTKQAVNAEVLRYQRIAALEANSQVHPVDAADTAQPRKRPKSWLGRVWARFLS